MGLWLTSLRASLVKHGRLSSVPNFKEIGQAFQRAQFQGNWAGEPKWAPPPPFTGGGATSSGPRLSGGAFRMVYKPSRSVPKKKFGPLFLEKDPTAEPQTKFGGGGGLSYYMYTVHV